MTSLSDIETRRAPGLSRRALDMPASPIRKLAPLAEAAKARGTHVLHLNIGQPDIETPACMRDRLKQLDSRVLEYSPSTGTPEFIRRSEEHTSELQSRRDLVCRLLLEKKKKRYNATTQ